MSDFEQPVIQKLIDQASAHPGFEDLLVASIQQADDIAKNGDPGATPPVAPLDPKLYDAVGKLVDVHGNQVATGWPTSWDEYLDYLRWFDRWTPRQNKQEPGWQRPHTPEWQEAYDRLCHFYWLIDQKVGTGGSKIVQDIKWFYDWLVEYAKAWGRYLDTTESFEDDTILQSFIDDPWYRIHDSMIQDPTTGEWRPNTPSGWKTFNQFFARELNPGLRPILEPTNNAYVVSPADCTYRNDFPIGPDSKIDPTKVKGTHTYYGVDQLLDGSGYADSFANGHFVHYFLAPYSYHRFHTPVAGTVKECYPIAGGVFLEVNLNDGQFDAPDSSAGGHGYEFTQARGVITIDTAGSPYGDIGVVAVIPIGMCQVSGVNMIHPAESTPGTPEQNAAGIECQKGDEFGFFTFGGSDIIVLFQERAKTELILETNYHHYGSAIARCSPWSA